MDHVLEDPRALQAFVSRAAQTLALLGSGAALLLALAATRLPEAAGDIRLLAAVTFVTSWLPLLTVWRGGHRIAIALIALPIGIGAPLTSLFVLPGLEDYLNARAVAETMNERSPATAPLAVFAAPAPSLKFYTRRNVVNVTPDRDALASLRADDGLAYAAFPPSAEADVTRRLGVPLDVLKRTPEAVLVRMKPDAARDSAAAAGERPAPRESSRVTAR
jgi:hypothetical protein